MNRAIFVSCSWNYVPYLNALLNSIEKRNIKADVYLLHWEFPQKYLEDVHKLSYNIIPIEIFEKDHRISGIHETGKNLFLKQARFHYIQKHGKDYDSICMLDADNFIVSENFNNLFDLVEGTNKLVGCEEQYKWTFGKNHMCRNESIFQEDVKALKFMCSVPIIFDLNKWDDVFTTYNDMAFHSYEQKPDQLKRIGDIYTWSISIYKNHRENDCILLPMHSMTQVHGTYGAFWCALQKHGDKWYNKDGCETYSIHGRIGSNSDWSGSPQRWYAKTLESHGIPFEGKIKTIWDKSIKLVESEWYDLNFNGTVKLTDYIDLPDYYNNYKG